MLVLDQTNSNRNFYFDVWFSNLIDFQKCPCFWHHNWQYSVNNHSRFVQTQSKTNFLHKTQSIKIVPSTSSSFVQCLRVNVLMICKSYKVLVRRKKQTCGNISCFAKTEVWSFDFGHYQPRASQIKVNMNIFWVISPSLQQNINSTQNLENKNTLF